MAKTLKKLPQWAKKAWSGMTSDNRHIHVRIAMAEYLQKYQPSFVLYLRLFRTLADVQKDCPYCDWLANENSVTDNMLEEVEKQFGKEVRDEFIYCLQ